MMMQIQFTKFLRDKPNTTLKTPKKKKNHLIRDVLSLNLLVLLLRPEGILVQIFPEAKKFFLC